MRFTKGLVLAAGALTLLFGLAAAQDAGDDEIGLDKNSVFATPDPIIPRPASMEPGENDKVGGYFDEMPPVISHQIEDLLPITAAENLCLDCHDDPSRIGEETGDDEPTPIPASHYTDLRNNPDEVTDKLIGARFDCTQCHVSQTNAEPLVVNTYQE